ncbi:uncharacterized protein K02A2.6-like [Photinus pyralis]|uniref:uncharacterized protein K02A2.6-like n=1 Tax=Photinus pyralis TaxID=7054 RepID=UPI0012671392|nr:uncharacterized protein K02A2.6-like [Photinus pyralis]
MAASTYNGYIREFNPKECNWTIYKERLFQFFIVNNVDKQEIKRALLLNACNEESYQLISNLCVPNSPDATDFKALIELCDKHFAPQKALFPERFKFYHANRNVDETIMDWAARVKNLASKCKFGSELSVAMRDKFIVGMEDKAILNRLFEEDVSTLTLDKAIDIALSKEAVLKNYEASANTVIKQEPMEVYKTSQQWATDKRKGSSSSSSNQRAEAGSAGASRAASRRGGRSSGPQGKVGQDAQCAVCGKNHGQSKCRYRYYTCNKCGVKGHLMAMCNSTKSRKQFFIEDDLNDDCIYSIKGENNPIFVSVKIANLSFTFEIDTVFKNYTGGKMIPLGYIVVPIEYKGVMKDVKLFVLRDGGPPLLGRDFFYKYELCINSIRMEGLEMEIFRECEKVFANTLGKFTKGKIKLNLKEAAIPKFQKARVLPFAMREKVEKEIARLVDIGVLVKVDYSEWGTPVVPILKKDGSIRLCGDYKVTLNPSLQEEPYPIPRVEELFAKLCNGKQFSKIDLSQAYSQIELDSESQMLTTISTHKGLFKYTRLPFGVSSAPKKFQKIMERVLQSTDGVVCFYDDVLVTGSTKEEHVRRLKDTLKRLGDCGLTVRKDKCSFFQESIEYLGYRIDKHGLHTCPKNIKAIQEAPRPINVTQLQGFLGMINYYNKFIPSAATVLRPLYDLLKKGVIFQWNAACEDAFKRVKDILTSAEVLIHFDSSLPIRLTVDASQYGVGAVISHVTEGNVERPIACNDETVQYSNRCKCESAGSRWATVCFHANRLAMILFHVNLARNILKVNLRNIKEL